jgi:hypothetical protein
MSASVAETSFGKSVSSIDFMNAFIVDTASFTVELSFSINLNEFLVQTENMNMKQKRERERNKPLNIGIFVIVSSLICVNLTCLCWIHSWCL